MAGKKMTLAAALCVGVVLGGITGCGDGSGGESDGKGTRAVQEKERPDAEDGATPPADRDKPAGEDSSAGSRTPSGVEKLSAEDIVKRSGEALASAGTVRMSTPDGGNDMRVDRAGDCSGTFTQEKYSSHLIKKGDKIWLKPEDAYWNDPAAKPVLAKTPQVRGKYLHGTSEKSLVLLFASVFCMVGEQMLSGDFEGGKGVELSKGAVTTVEGRKVVPVHADSAEKGRSTILVATEGRPYPLKLETAEGKETILLSDFGKPFTPPASPPAGDTVDATEAELFGEGSG
ncbi:hypothetical protein ABZ905_27345 [Streptomyces parvus]|uniref:hypothetical protein n=1 Tax=Streptomyces parvus TaxID=66428 RepID=UPI0033EC243C